MSTKPIQNTDIASPDVYTKLITETKELLKMYTSLDAELTKVVKNVAKVAQGYKSNVAGDIQKAAAAEKQLTQAMLDSEKIKRAKIQTEKSLIGLNKQKETALLREKKAVDELNNAYVQESKTLNTLRNSYKNLAAQNKANTKEARAMLQEITRLDTKLKAIDRTVGQSQRNVGNYTSAISKLRGGMTSLLGVASRLGLVMGGGMIIRNSFNVIADFEQANADLAAILGKTTEQTKALQEEQRRLGGSTSFTASQVAELQTELAKLGFTQDELLNATEGVLLLAKASGTDLANAAEIAGATLRGFSLDASEMGRVTDVMAKSFSTSALDISKFKESMKDVAPIANAAGVSIEEATAMLGALANAGISGSKAGTALRRILNEMALTGKPAAQALKDLSEQGISLADAQDEVGRNAQTALLVLAKNKDVVEQLTEEYQNASGAAKQMADIKDNTLTGALNRLNSKWQEFLLNLNAGTGAGAKFRKMIEFITRNLTTIISLIAKVTVGFIAYKSAVLLINAQTKISIALEQLRAKGLGSLILKQKQNTSAVQAGTQAQVNYNAAAKNLLVSGILIFLGNIAAAWYDVASGAKNARLQTEAFNKAAELGNEKASKFATEQREKMEQELRDVRKLGLTESELQKEREKIQEKYINETEKKILINDVFRKRLKKETEALNQINKAIEGAQTTETINILTAKGEKQVDKIQKILKELELQGIKLGDDSFLGVTIFGEGSFSATARAGLAGVEELSKEIEGLTENSKNLKNELDELVTQDLEIKDFSKDFKKQQQTLTGLAKLQKELADLEKLRSDYLVANDGVIDATFIKMTNQTRELERQIAAYNLVLDKLGQIEKFERRGGLIATEKGKSTLATGDVDLTKLSKKAEKTPEELAAELEALKQLSENFTDFTVMLIDRRIEALDRENEAQQRNYDEAKSREQELIELRKAGVVVEAESIAFEKKAQAEALKEQEKIAKKKQRLELTNSAIQMFNASVQQGGANPLGKTMADVTALIGFIRTIPTFWTGTDSTVGDTLGIKYSNGRDGVLARVDASEMILNKGKVDTLRNYGITTTDGIIEAIEMQKFSPKGVSMTSPMVYNDNSEVVKELQGHKQLLQQIANKPVVQNDIEHFDKIIKISQTITTPRKLETITKNTRIR